MKFNVEDMNQVCGSLNNVFAPLKSLFDFAKKMTLAAGENKLSEQLNAHFKKLENTFNDAVIPSFDNMKADLRQSAENMEAFDKAMNGIEMPNTSAADNVDQKRHTTAFSAV